MNTQLLNDQEALHKELAATVRLMRIKSDAIAEIPDNLPLNKEAAEKALNKVFEHYKELESKLVVLKYQPARNDMVIMAEHFAWHPHEYFQ